MIESRSAGWSWEVSRNAVEVHALLLACDAYQATSATPAPRRNFATTERRVREHSVHVLRRKSEAVAMFTLSWDPPFDEDSAIFPAARKCAYLGRLAVSPEWLGRGSLLGARCLRKVTELAERAGADAIRAEANPDLTEVRALLDLFGFEQHGPTLTDHERRRVHLQKSL